MTASASLPAGPDAAPPAAPLPSHIAAVIGEAGGWIGFDRFMALALYTPGLGYYSRGSSQFGAMPVGVKGGGGDFVTAPELSPAFGATLAVQVADALRASGTDEVWEFGAGTGALAEQLLGALGAQVLRYTIVDLSGSLRQRQQMRLAPFGDKVRWLSELPDRFTGVVVGNEVLDAMPVQLLARVAGHWFERGVALDAGGHFTWADRPTEQRPPMEIAGEHDYLTETHAQGRAFAATLADRLERGVALLLDYGFPEAEYYHPQRHMGTLICHQGHQAGGDPLEQLGHKDITAHVNFTGIALAGQDAGLAVLGYTTQARFLLNCGLLASMEQASPAARAAGQKLITEHEMGELFKVVAFGRPDVHGEAWEPLGFAQGDRSHTL